MDGRSSTSNTDNQGTHPRANDAPCSAFAHTDRLFELIEQRLLLARQLDQMSSATTQATAADGPDALISVLGKKQNLIECLTVIQDELRAFQSDDPDSRIWQTQAKRAECRQMVEESTGILTDLTRQEEATLAQALAQRDAIAAQLRAGQDTKTARNAYAASQGVGTRLLDIGGV